MARREAGRGEPVAMRGGLWGHRDFLKLWAAQTISLLGAQVGGLAIPLTAITALQAGPAQMGLLVAAENASWLLLGLPAGVWADRFRRRPTMMAANLGRSLLLCSVPLAAYLGVLGLEQLYVVAFLAGALAVFFFVAYHSYLPSLVRRDQLVEANSRLALSDSAAEIAGPGLAGALVQAVGAPFAVLADAASYVVSALFLRSIQAPELPRGGRGDRSAVGEVVEGLSVVARDPTLRALMGAVGTFNLFGNVIMTVYLLFVSRELGLSPGLIGVVIAVGSVGFVPGSLLAGRVGRRFGIGPALIGAVVAVGAADALIPLAAGSEVRAVATLIVAHVLAGGCRAVVSINGTTLRQTATPERLLGRVNATYVVFGWGVPILGAGLAALLGETVGLRPTLAVGAGGEALAALWLVFSPVRSLRERPDR